jgi:hypothetical protein
MQEHNFCEVIDGTILNMNHIVSIIRINGTVVINASWLARNGINEEKYVFNNERLTAQFKDFLTN